ncbi:ATP-binding protein [Nocardiopsis exhalans]|uniref:Anti-sigma regulatory factor (Ser/Thr protein kinase) n=2 Tax=Nocardiopsis TaxID=2013 RepID=A0A840WQC8_9ACTN|nr:MULTISPECIES: ATP-binding protein [Nocardiopsis]MBB5494055.1 anti-sigma regulatory factor (Ser/Thr protein kinase) [Nocardiopsis metallicus]
MSIVPHLSPARWRARIYPGQLPRMSTVRADLRADLAGFGEDLVETLTLCASELVANAIEHTLSGDSGGRVLRALFESEPGVLRLVVVDDGARESAPQIPTDRTEQEWLSAERGRGLLMVEMLAVRWGAYPVVPFPFCADLGTAVWAEFLLGGGER